MGPVVLGHLVYRIWWHCQFHAERHSLHACIDRQSLHSSTCWQLSVGMVNMHCNCYSADRLLLLMMMLLMILAIDAEWSDICLLVQIQCFHWHSSWTAGFLESLIPSSRQRFSLHCCSTGSAFIMVSARSALALIHYKCQQTVVVVVVVISLIIYVKCGRKKSIHWWKFVHSLRYWISYQDYYKVIWDKL